ncbi:unnamed protein product [Ilex paraguariensis]|uniref:Disease resistance protein n=1 Tax=Ilex paraguariensis TaxID=185542 RepID=A0ABC8S9L3_9AQUA
MGNFCSVSLSIDNLIPRCFDCTAAQVNSFRRLDDWLANLRTALEELKQLRNDVKTEVDVAERQPMMKRLEQVQGWLLQVESMETEVNKLIANGSQEIDKNCYNRYKLGKKVAKKIKDVAALKSKGDFEVVAKRLPSDIVDIRPSEPTVGTESNFSKIWGHLQEEHVGIIGIYGLGGVGKTTLMTQINNKFASPTNDFDVVIWVTVSSTVDMDKVQDDIGKTIGLHNETWNNKSLDEKAIQIYGVLSKKKFVLLLDDIWESLNLSQVGIPIPNEQNKCKVAFTTRSEEVCGKMDAQKKVKVECLPWEKAWDLFQKKIGDETLKSDPAIPGLAELVAKECGGLPLALITVGRAMAYKQTPQAWKHAIKVLKNYAVRFPGMETKVFCPLHLSYDSLPSDTVKSCFVYCSLYPEDSLILIEDLINKWIGEGFLNEWNDNEDGAENQGYDNIDTLLQACLLEKISSDKVKMHDVIREMALWIGREYEKQTDKFLVRAGGRETKAPEVSKWKEVKRMSLMVNKIERLIGTPICPQLTTLLLNENSLKMISSGFFQYMHALKVLDLSMNRSLVDLPLEIGELTSLEYLNISCTKISRLPVQLQNLVNLKILDMDYTKCDQTSIQVISGLSSLQVLKMIDSVFINNEALVEKLDALKFLYYLSMTMGNAFVFQGLKKCHKLQSCIRYLRLQFFSRCITFNISSLQFLKCLNYLNVSNWDDCEDWVIDWTVEGKEIETSNNPLDSHIKNPPSFHSLRTVIIMGCRRLKNVKWLLYAPNLVYLEIMDCSKMEEVISRDEWMEVAKKGKISNPFAKLESLYIQYLPQLTSIYHSPLPFHCLKYLNVRECPGLKKLPLNSDSAREHRTVIAGSKDWFDKLEWHDEATQNAFLPGSQILQGGLSVQIA